MKKIYFAPKTEIVKVQTESLLNVVSGGSGEVNSVSGGEEYTGEGSEVLSRRGTIWGDEEE